MAKITLRKAAQISSSISTYIRKNAANLHYSFELVSNMNASDAFDKFNKKNFETTSTQFELSSINAKLRTKIGTENNNAGVNSLLSELGSINEQLVIVNGLLSSKTLAAEPAAIARVYTERYNKYVTQTASVYGQSDSLTGVSIDPSFVSYLETMLKKLNKRKIEINDNLIVINTTNFVDIDDVEFAFLENLGIV